MRARALRVSASSSLSRFITSKHNFELSTQKVQHGGAGQVDYLGFRVGLGRQAIG